MSAGARRGRAGSNRAQAGSGSPKNDEARGASFQRLLRLASEDIPGMAAECQQRYASRDNALRWVRYENAAAAVQMYRNIRTSRRCFEDFADEFDVAFGRPPNKKKMLRDSFLLAYGKARTSAAGTDASALAGMVRDGVRAADIPQSIKDNGGLEKMRRDRAQRDEHPKLTARIDARRLARFDRLRVGDRLFAQIRRVADTPRGKPTYVIVRVWSSLPR